jgi:hypothetical protein
MLHLHNLELWMSLLRSPFACFHFLLSLLLAAKLNKDRKKSPIQARKKVFEFI